MNGTGHSLQALFQDRPWTSDIHSRKPFSSLPKFVALVQCHLGLLSKELFECLRIHSQFAAIEPYQIGSFRLDHFDGLYMGFNKVCQKSQIVSYIREALIQPFITVSVGRFGRPNVLDRLR